MKNQVVKAAVTNFATNGWDCVGSLIQKLPVETLQKCTPLILVLGSGAYVADRYFNYQFQEAKMAMENGYNYSHGRTNLTKEVLVAS